MNQSQGTPALKRKRPELPPLAPSLTEHERTLYDIIRSKQNLGIWIREMKSQAKLSDNVVTKCLNALRNKNLIKDVVNYQNKAKKTVMAAEFEPSKEITGGSWYLDGSLDQDLITMLKALCVKLLNINKPGVVTVEGMTDLCNRTGAYQAELTRQQVEEILRALVLDNEIMQVKSNGMGEFTGIPTGKDCYKAIRKRGPGGKAKIPGALASIPCGVCPRISLCTPDGVISPTTCVYYNKWLDF